MSNGDSMSAFESLLTERERAWTDLRERLARAARELHFAGVASQTGESAALLAIATNLAGLAMSIALAPSHRIEGPVEASTLFAAQILRRAHTGSALTVTKK
jgi:hypothetical protein